MAIFLLISVGSVCASEIADVEDVVSTDDGSEVVLANENAAPKIDTKIVSDDNVIIEKGQDQKIPVTVNDNASKPISVSKENLKVSENSKQLNFTYSNNEIKFTNLPKGNHSLLITYLGNGIYKNSTKNVILSIVGANELKVSGATVNQTNIVEAPVTLTDEFNNIKNATASDFSVRLDYENGTKKIVPSKYENGKLIFDISSVEKRDYYNMTVTSTAFRPETLIHTPVKITRVNIVKIIPLNTETDYQAGNFTFKIVDYYNTNESYANKKITLDMGILLGNSITISSSRSFNTDSNGIITIKNDNTFYMGTYAPAGIHNLTLKGKEDTSGSLKTTVKINNIASKITVEKYNEYFGSNKNVKIIVVNAKTNKPLSVPVYFKMTDSTGKEITFTTTGANNTKVKVNTRSTNSNGYFELPIKNLMPGTYSITASVNKTDSYSASNITSAVTVKKIPIKYTISTNGKITVTNKTGKKVPGAIVLIKYDKSKNKQFITQTTTGVIEIVTVGKHTVQVVNEDPRYSAKAVTKPISNKKITAKASAPKVTTYYKAEKYFTVKLTNSAKKPIYDAKLNIKVYVSSSRYYNYKGNTGIDGKINLGLDSLKPGTYKVVVTSGATKNFALKKVTSKIVVKKAPAKLTPTKLTAKKGVKKYFKVTVKNTKTKKVIKGVKVKIKVYTGKKYKTYTVKTNSKGIANLNVKSLKVGSHKVVVSSANKYVVAKAAKSTIIITKK